jgi:hypothetical protein
VGIQHGGLREARYKYLAVFSDTKADVVIFNTDIVVFSWLFEDNLPRLITDSDC